MCQLAQILCQICATWHIFSEVEVNLKKKIFSLFFLRGKLQLYHKIFCLSYNCIICKNRVPTYCKAVGCGASLCRECFTQHVLELTPSRNKPVSRLGHSNAGRKRIRRSMNRSCNLRA